MGLHSFEPTIASSRFEFLQTQSRGSVDYFSADLGSGTRETAHALIDSAWKRMGGIDLLVLAAGTYREPPLLDVSSSDLDRIMNLNVKSPFFAAQRYAQRIAEIGVASRFTYATNHNRNYVDKRHHGGEPARSL